MTTQVKFAEWELLVIREAIRIGVEDGSLTAFAGGRELEKLSRKIERARIRAKALKG